MTEKDLEIQELRRKLKAAIADIPHVGRFCAYREDGRGDCKLDGELCCKQVNTACERWKWKGSNT